MAVPQPGGKCVQCEGAKKTLATWSCHTHLWPCTTPAGSSGQACRNSSATVAWTLSYAVFYFKIWNCGCSSHWNCNCSSMASWVRNCLYKIYWNCNWCRPAMGMRWGMENGTVSLFLCFCISDIAWRMEKVCTEWLENYMEDEEGMNGILDIGLLTEQSDRRICFSCASLFFSLVFLFCMVFG